MQQDITISLFVNEIHLKPYIDYKGSNIVGFSYNSKEAVTSGLVFMLNSVF